MSEDTITLDVRADIRAGREPFSKIMEAVARLQAGEKLIIIAPFEPAPLFSVLAKQGFRHDSKRTATGDWQVLFSRDSHSLSEPGSRPGEVLNAGAKANLSPLTTTAKQTQDLDARGLEPPQPLVTILEALESLPGNVTLRAHTDRRPMHLYAQLEERGFTGESQEQTDGSFITHICRR